MNWKKAKQLQRRKEAMARQLNEINKEYSELCGRLGDLEAKLMFAVKERDSIREQLVTLDAEAREAIAASKITPPTAPSTNVPEEALNAKSVA